MELLLPFLLVGAFLMGVTVGRFLIPFPEEDVMIRHLIDLRVKRKLKTMTKDQVKQELEEASERVASTLAKD